ncbi:hypothetical protein PIB30_026222 [Stylosanthes scabra]|uniref:Uncharacterized protein n=1 Tax=Stylosanthes scabra TaxID=79078 RepID=A0ABU6ZAP2_9FABA|nr:hypothetical protein [Stylosanthes scabra]
MVLKEFKILAEFVLNVVFNLSIGIPIGNNFAIQVSLAPLQVIADVILTSDTILWVVIVVVIAAVGFTYLLFKRREQLATIPTFLRGQEHLGRREIVPVFRAVLSVLFRGEPPVPIGYQPLARQPTAHVDEPPILVDESPFRVDEPPVRVDPVLVDEPPVLVEEPVVLVDELPDRVDEPPVRVDPVLVDEPPPVLVEEPPPGGRGRGPRRRRGHR